VGSSDGCRRLEAPLLLRTISQTAQRPASGTRLRQGLRPATPSDLNANNLQCIHQTQICRSGDGRPRRRRPPIPSQFEEPRRNAGASISPPASASIRKPGRLALVLSSLGNRGPSHRKRVVSDVNSTPCLGPRQGHGFSRADQNDARSASMRTPVRPGSSHAGESVQPQNPFQSPLRRGIGCSFHSSVTSAEDSEFQSPLRRGIGCSLSRPPH
jgi:hypothetical protein